MFLLVSLKVLQSRQTKYFMCHYCNWRLLNIYIDTVVGDTEPQRLSIHLDTDAEIIISFSVFQNIIYSWAL